MNVIEKLQAKIALCDKAVNILLDNPKNFKSAIEDRNKQTHIGIFDDVRLEVGFYDYGAQDWDLETGEDGTCLGFVAVAKLRDHDDIEVEVDLEEHNCRSNYLSTLDNLIERFGYAEYEIKQELETARRHQEACGPNASNIELELVSGDYEPTAGLRVSVHYNSITVSLSTSGRSYRRDEKSWTETYLEGLQDLHAEVSESCNNMLLEIDKVQQALDAVKEKQ